MTIPKERKVLIRGKSQPNNRSKLSKEHSLEKRVVDLAEATDAENRQKVVQV